MLVCLIGLAVAVVAIWSIRAGWAVQKRLEERRTQGQAVSFADLRRQSDAEALPLADELPLLVANLNSP